jgi:hypothetical protein
MTIRMVDSSRRVNDKIVLTRKTRQETLPRACQKMQCIVRSRRDETTVRGRENDSQ